MERMTADVLISAGQLAHLRQLMDLQFPG